MKDEDCSDGGIIKSIKRRIRLNVYAACGIFVCTSDRVRNQAPNDLNGHPFTILIAHMPHWKIYAAGLHRINGKY